MNIYLDNKGSKVPGDWYHCKNVSEVISLLNQSPESKVSIDYTNGMIFLKWLYHQLKTNTNFVPPIVFIHTLEINKQKELYNLYCTCLDQDWHNHQIKLKYTDSQIIFFSHLFLWSCIIAIWFCFLPTWSSIVLVPFIYLNIGTTYRAWYKHYKLMRKEHDSYRQV